MDELEKNDSDLLVTAKALARGNPWAFNVWLEGLTDEELLALRMQLGIDAFVQASEALVELFRGLWEAIKAAAEAIIEFVQAVARELFNLSPVRRLVLYFNLRQRWYIPDRLALWLARHCPLRWLPAYT